MCLSSIAGGRRYGCTFAFDTRDSRVSRRVFGEGREISAATTIEIRGSYHQTAIVLSAPKGMSSYKVIVNYSNGNAIGLLQVTVPHKS